jgi:beta-lactamase class A
MGIRRGSLVTALVLTASVIALAAVGSASAAQGRASGTSSASASMICTSATRHRFAVWLSQGIDKALAGRKSVVGLTVADPHLGLTCALRETSHFDAASAIKVTIISALLLAEHGPSHLTAKQKSLAWLMITRSDNNAATALWDHVGIDGMRRFLNKAGMRHTILSHAWGLTQLTAQDELTLLQLLANPNRVLGGPSRRYVLGLMAHVVPSQRWGVPAGAPARIQVSVKNGWLPDPGNGAWHINSIGAFSGQNVSYQIAILTSGNRTEGYGIDTIEAAARVINRDISLARG